MGSLMVFDYMYRDGSNYKAYGSILVELPANYENHLRLLANLDPDRRFIPEYVGIPPLLYKLCRYGGPTADDHQLHEFIELRRASPEEITSMERWGSLSELLASLERERHRWIL